MVDADTTCHLADSSAVPDAMCGTYTLGAMARASFGLCRNDLIEARRHALPFYRATSTYAPYTPPVGGPVQLVRSRLSCGQLAAAHSGNPVANEDVHTVDCTSPDGTCLGSLVSGGRAAMQNDLVRICQWVKTVDRDAVDRYYGLNYRGQVLVEAARLLDDSADEFLITETLYNADGNVIESRSPGTSAWQAGQGRTIQQWDDPDPNGHNGWNGWVPAFWARRGNLRHVTIEPRDAVVERDIDAGPYTVTSRELEMTWEPLFNQLKSVVMREVGAPEPWVFGRINDFDYEELPPPTAGASSPMSVYLRQLALFGFDLYKDRAVDPESPWHDKINWNTVLSWQVPVTFKDADLNNDGVRGFSNDPREDRPRHRIKGVVVRSREYGRSSTDPRPDPNRPHEDRLISWAPSGLPTAIIGPEGRVDLRYYQARVDGLSDAEMYGVGAEPGDAAAYDHAGFLARVERRRFNPHPVGTDDPSASACGALASPYRWLLPACPDGPETGLLQLGLAQDVVDAIVAADDADVTRTSYRWNVLGSPMTTWQDGVPLQQLRDTDGHVLEATDAQGNSHIVRYDHLGLPVDERAENPDGDLLTQTRTQRDAEGRPLTVCRAMVEGACALSDIAPLAFGTPSTPYEQLETARYSGEGGVTHRSDPVGTVTRTLLDGLGRPLDVRVHRAWPAKDNLDRRARFEYTVDGQLSKVTYGTRFFRLGNPLRDTEHWTYDGFGRVRTRTDARGLRWEYDYTALHQVARATAIWTDAGQAEQVWTVAFGYDSFGRPARRSVQDGAFEASILRWPDGTPRRISQTGLGDRWLTFDADGQLLWSLDSAGDQTVTTWDPVMRRVTEASILTHSGDASTLAVSAVTDLDLLGRPVERRTLGANGEVQVETSEFDGVGRLIRRLDAAGQEVRWELNLLGWPDAVQDAYTATSFATATQTFNGRGQVLTVHDPNGAQTTFTYNAFGQVVEERVAGMQPHSMNYDALGRMVRETLPTGEDLEYTYDARGDRVKDWWTNGPVSGPSIERTFDAFGRITAATRHNHGLVTVGLPGQDVLRQVTYDTLGRVESETLQVAGTAPRTTTSIWSLTADRWQRELIYPSGKTVQESFDASQRLETLVLDPGWGRTADLSWLGSQPAGRDHTWNVNKQPLEQSATFDGLARPLGQTWKAPGAWSFPGYSNDLYTSAAVRDVRGHLMSVQWRFGHPMKDNFGGLLPESAHAIPWSGYTYDLRGMLSAGYHHAGVGTHKDPSSLVNHLVTNAQVATKATGWPSATKHTYTRDARIGSLSTIKVGTTTTFKATRDSNRRLTNYIPQGSSTSIPIAIDPAGRMTDDGHHTLTWSPDDLLLSAHAGSTLLEAYAWTDDGRLAARYDATGLQETFSHDGAQLIASSTPSNTPIWQAVWGGTLDQLVEFETVNGATTTTYVPLTDHRNAVVGLWRSAPGELAQILDYDDHGRLTVRDDHEQVVCAEVGESAPCAAAALLPFQFSSAWRSSVTGMSLMRRRWYAPRLAQFVSADPLLFVDSYDVWAFAAFDPINRWDPWGLGSGGTAPPGTGAPGMRRGDAGDGWADFGIDTFIRPAEAAVQQSPWERAVRTAAGPLLVPAEMGLGMAGRVVQSHQNGDGVVAPVAGFACELHPGCNGLWAGYDLYQSVEAGDDYGTGYNGARAALGVANVLGVVVGGVGGGKGGGQGLQGAGTAEGLAVVEGLAEGEYYQTVAGVRVIGPPKLETAPVGSLRGRQVPTEYSGSHIRRYRKWMESTQSYARPSGAAPPIDIVNVGDRRIIIDGHHRARAAGSAGLVHKLVT